MQNTQKPETHANEEKKQTKILTEYPESTFSGGLRVLMRFS